MTCIEEQSNAVLGVTATAEHLSQGFWLDERHEQGRTPAQLVQGPRIGRSQTPRELEQSFQNLLRVRAVRSVVRESAREQFGLFLYVFRFLHLVETADLSQSRKPGQLFDVVSHKGRPCQATP